jgi:nucleoside-diphosphate-sugar epimerase
VVRGDITDARTLGPAVKDIDLVIHLAGMMGVWRPLADYRWVKVDIREGLRLATEWFNAGGMEQPFVTQASQYVPLAGAQKP